MHSSWTKKVIFPLTLILVFAGISHSADADVAAKYWGKTMTVKDFYDFIEGFAPEKKKHLMENAQSRETLLKRMVEVRSIAEIARKQGIDKHEQVKKQIEYYSDELLAQEYIKQHINKIEVADKDLKQYYLLNEKNYQSPETVKASHILFKVATKVSESERMLSRAEAKNKADKAVARIKAGEDFAKIAGEISEDPATSKKGGDLGFFPRKKMDPAFEAKAFTLKPGEVSEPVETRFGYHIIKVIEKADAKTDPFEKVKDKVREAFLLKLKKDKQADIVEKAMKEAGAEIAPEKVAARPVK